VVVFNTVTNTVVDSLKSDAELGYSLAPRHTVSILQCTDDTCLVARSPTACQTLLDRTEQWLQWSLMKPKVSKCHSVAIQSSSGKVIDPQLMIMKEKIPFMGSSSIEFLGMRIEFPSNSASAKHEFKQRLESIVQAVDKTPLTIQQKLKIYRHKGSARGSTGYY
jgi:outer membrane protein OmpA-like peptidoglycan-associated protein